MSENENPFVDMDSIKACREAYDNLFSRLGPESLATLRAKQALVAAILDKADDTSEAYSLVKELAEELGSSAYSTRDEFDDVAYLYACAAYDNEDDVELAINAAQMAYSSYSQLVCMRVDDNLLDCLVDSCNLLLDLYEEQENAMAALVLLYDCCGILATTDNRYDSSIVDLLFSLGCYSRVSAVMKKRYRKMLNHFARPLLSRIYERSSLFVHLCKDREDDGLVMRCAMSTLDDCDSYIHMRVESFILCPEFASRSYRSELVSVLKGKARTMRLLSSHFAKLIEERKEDNEADASTQEMARRVAEQMEEGAKVHEELAKEADEKRDVDWQDFLERCIDCFSDPDDL